MAVIAAAGITTDGAREVIGVDVGDSEDEVFWRGFSRSMRQCRLGRVKLVISDQQPGLVVALRRASQGSAHQRCRLHFARNLLALVPKRHQGMVAAVFRTIFAQPDPETVSITWGQVRDQLATHYPKTATLMSNAKTDVLAFTGFPRSHWVKIWSTNPLEWMNIEIARRSRVAGIFPNEAAVIRLLGAVLADMDDEWQAGESRYRSDTSMAELHPIPPNSNPANEPRGSSSKPHHSTGRCPPTDSSARTRNSLADSRSGDEGLIGGLNPERIDTPVLNA